MSASPEGIRIKGRDLQSLLKRGAANFIKRPIEPEAPLRVMEGFSQILLEDDGSELPQQLQGYLKTIQEEARRTAALIEHIIASSEQNGQPLSRSQRR